MKHQLVDSGAEVMVIFAHSLEEIVATPPVKHIVITELGNQLGGMKRTVVNGVIRYIKKMVPRYHLPTAVSFGAALKKESQRFFQRVTPQGDDTAFSAIHRRNHRCVEGCGAISYQYSG